jgi:hypothetical protein
LGKIAKTTRNTLDIEPTKCAATTTPLRSISFAPIVASLVSAPCEPTPSSGTAHLGQIDAKLTRHLVQHAARYERHDDHEEDLVRVAARVCYELAQQVSKLVV